MLVLRVDPREAAFADTFPTRFASIVVNFARHVVSSKLNHASDSIGN